MPKLLVLIGTVLVALVFPARDTVAQTSTSVTSQAGPVSIAIDGGLAAGSPGSGAAIGARVGFNLTDRLELEATGAYLDRGAGADAFNLNAALLVNLVITESKAVPYLAVGGGLYRASFDLGHQRFFGGLTGQFPSGTRMIPIAGMHGFGMAQGPYAGPAVWTGQWAGMTYTPNRMPGFYVDRLGQMVVPANGRWDTRSFTDPAFSFGGGVRVDLSPRLYVRPDARALVIIANGDTYTVGVFSLGLGYRF